MVALRNRPLAAFSGPFWLSAFGAAFAPTSVGYQDLAAFLARQPGVSERAREHPIASPFPTIQVATFRYSRPIGTAMSEPIGAQPVNFDPRSLDVKVWFADEPPRARTALHIEYPTINRSRKGDRLPLPARSPGSAQPASLPALQPINAPSSQPVSPPAPAAVPLADGAEQIEAGPAPAQMDAANEAFGSVPTADPAGADALAAPRGGDATNAGPSSSPTLTTRADASGAASQGEDGRDDVALADRPPEIPAAGENDPTDAALSPFASLSFFEEDAAERNEQLFFDAGNTASAGGGLERWAPGTEPILASQPSADPDLKLSALDGAADAGADAGGETLAGKDDASRLETPAQRLGLSGEPRAKAEKCLADAVYFEARGEPLKGQEAVAQVVMNRVFSGFYPTNVCGVVYQNADRHLACQFTFACEGKDLSRIDEPDMWAQAKRIAKDTLDGKIWLPEVGHATHYHAYWVHPSWVHEMAKLYQLGVHTFYRPRAWGDGSDAPIWGNVPAPPKPAGIAAENPEARKDSEAAKDPAAAAKNLDAAKGPQAALSPEPKAGQTRS